MPFFNARLGILVMILVPLLLGLKCFGVLTKLGVPSHSGCASAAFAFASSVCISLCTEGSDCLN